jgi:hypothetical protein
MYTDVNLKGKNKKITPYEWSDYKEEADKP